MFLSWSASPCRILFTPLSIINHLCNSTFFFFFISQTPFCYFAAYHHHHAVIEATPFEQKFPQSIELLLQDCSRTHSLSTAKSLHALTITIGSEQPIFVNNNLLAMYARIGDLGTARKVFDKMPERNTVSWNSLITAYSRQGHGNEVLKLFSQMMAIGLKPTQFTLSSVLALCSRCCDYVDNLGFLFYPLILKTGFLSADAFAGTALLGLLAKQGFLNYALNLFDEMPERNIVTWNSLISGFAEHGFVNDCLILFRELLRTEIHPSESSFVAVISSFEIEPGEQIHGVAIKTGADFYIAVANALIKMYEKCFGLDFAEEIFEKMAVRDEVSWNTMITASAKHGKPGKALDLFSLMCAQGFLPTQTTFASILSSCASLNILYYGKFIHAKTVKNTLELDVFVGNALIDFYAKCDSFADARQAFDEKPEKSIASWNSLISCYSDTALPFKEMLASGFKPNEYTYSIALKSSSTSKYGLQQLHSQIIQTGFHHNEYVWSSIITAYAINGLISDAYAVAVVTSSLSPIPWNIIAGVYSKNCQYPEAHKLISGLSEPDIVSWNITIAACSKGKDYEQAFEVFNKMQSYSIFPDNYTFVSLLSACSELCNLGLGSATHGLILKTDFSRVDVFVCNILMDMYAKCGSLDGCLKVFDRMPHRNLISWTVLVSALGLHGYVREAIRRFEEMELLGFRPDEVAFIAVLSACRHGGLVEEGLALFGRMRSVYGIEPEVDHYHCVVDLLCRYGHVEEAERVITSMPFQPSAPIWRAFLSCFKG